MIKYTGQTYYEIDLAGRKEKLYLAEVAPNVHIAVFLLFGNTELTNYCAGVLAEKLKDVDFDYIVCPEAKTLPLVQSLCTILDNQEFIVFRKGPKAYMNNPISTDVKAITSSVEQTMTVDGRDADKLRGKKILIIDDVISTGSTMQAVETLLSQIDANIIGYASILKEGDDFKKEAIYIADLPLFIG